MLDEAGVINNSAVGLQQIHNPHLFGAWNQPALWTMSRGLNDDLTYRLSELQNYCS